MGVKCQHSGKLWHGGFNAMMRQENTLNGSEGDAILTPVFWWNLHHPGASSCLLLIGKLPMVLQPNDNGIHDLTTDVSGEPTRMTWLRWVKGSNFHISQN